MGTRSFPAGDGALVYDPAGSGQALLAKSGSYVTIYTDAAATTVATGLTHPDGSPIADGRLLVNATSRLPRFKDPAGRLVLYSKPDGSSVVTALYADSEEFIATANGVYPARRASGTTAVAATRAEFHVGDYASVQAAINAANAVGGGIVVLPEGNTYASGLVMYNYITLRGTGRNTVLRTSAGDLFAHSGSIAFASFENLTMLAEAAAGHIHALAAGATLDRCTWTDVQWVQQNPAKSIMSGPQCELIECTFDRWHSQHVATSTVPHFDLTTTVDAINVNRWWNGRVTFAGTYAFRIHSNGAAYAYDNEFRSINFEVCTAGLFDLRACVDTAFDSCVIYDPGSATTADLWRLDKSTVNNLRTRHTTFKHCATRGVTFGAGMQAIRCVNGGANNTIIEQCGNSAFNNFPIDFDSTDAIVIGGTQTPWLNDGQVTTITSGPAGTAWVPFTPVISTATGDAALGDGTATGRYRRDGKTVHFDLRIKRGSTTTFGTGGLRIDWPVARGGSLGVAALEGDLFRTGTGTYLLAGEVSTATYFRPMSIGTGGLKSVLTNTAPFTMAAGDYVDMRGSYEVP